MTPNAIFGLGLVTFALLVGAGELGYTINGSYAALVLAAAVSALYFSMARSAASGSVMANGPEYVEVKTPVGSAKVPASLVNNNGLLMLILAMQVAQAWFLYQHHLTGEEALRENTYVLSLSQPEREKLNLAMPDSLRKKQAR